MSEEDESLWTGVEVVQVRATELAKLHRALHAQRKTIVNLRMQMEDFVGLDKNTRCQVAALTREVQIKTMECSQRWKECREKDQLILAKDAENIRLKAALYDKNHTSR